MNKKGGGRVAKKNPRRSRHTAKTLDQASRVMQLRTVGADFRTIAKQLGISTTRAYDLQQIALKETLRESTDDYIAVQEQRVELLLRKAITGQSEASDGRDQAALINAALRATDQLNRMRGVYDRTETEAQTAAASLLDTLIETSKRAAAQTTDPEDTEQ